jgi:NAD(P)-dependent dehydrogenase (short-subunit alcohol dehydrogenase family)
VAKRLAQDGFRVVVNYLSNAAEAEEVVAELKRIGGNAVAIPADVSSPPLASRWAHGLQNERQATPETPSAAELQQVLAAPDAPARLLRSEVQSTLERTSDQLH